MTTFSHKKTDSLKKQLALLWKFSKGFRSTYGGAIFCLLLATACRTATFSLLGIVVDQGLSGTSALQTLLLLALGIIFLALLEGSFSFLSGRMAALTAEGIAKKLKDTLYDHIQHLPFAFHDRIPTGELIQRCTSDIDAVRRFFADQAIGVGRIFFLFVINWIAIAWLNLSLAAASVVAVPVILIVSGFFFRKVSRIYESYQDQDAVLSTVLQENLTGMRVVRAFSRQGYEEDKFESANLEKFSRGKKLLLMHSLFWPSTDILCAGQVVSAYFFGAWLTIQGSLSLGQYVTFVGLIVYLIWPMRDFGRLIVHASSGLVSAARLEEIQKEEPEPILPNEIAPALELAGEVEFRHVCFDYREETSVLKDVSFHCLPGQTIALLGPTGSGKTSLVNLLPRFYDYTGGSILLDGIELRNYSRAYLRKQIGIVEQEPFLFSRTIRENILFGVPRKVTEEEIYTAARQAALHNVVLGFPEGYNTLVGEKGVTLSGGQKQRVAIARTLLKNPRLLILDDSTSAVDSETESEIRAALQILMQDRTTFVIAHRIQSIENADLILVLDHGQIAQIGTHEELSAQEGFYREIYRVQSAMDEALAMELSSGDARS